MDFKSMLQQLSQLSEGTQETEKGRVHKADPGGYGRKFDTDEEGDEKKDAKKEPAVKRGRGRPKKGADSETGQVAKYDNAKNLQSFMVGNLPKGKLPGKPGKKHSLKEWVQEVEAKYVAEGVPPGMKPFSVVDPQNKQAGAGVVTSKNPAVQKMLGQLDPKDMQIVMTQPAAGSTQQPTQQSGQQTVPTGQAPAPAGSTGQAPVGSAQVKEKEEKWIQKAVKHPGAFTAKAKAAGKSVAAFAKEKEHAPGTLGKQARLAQTLKGLNKESVEEGDIPSTSGVDTEGANLGAGRSKTTLESSKNLPGNQEKIDVAEPKGKIDAKDFAKLRSKKKVNESVHKHNAARLLGKHHALAKEGYNCKYDDMEEARMYHEGYKEGLDECYGQMPVQGLVSENPMPATTPGMASAAMSPAMDEGNDFTEKLARTPHGGQFKVGDKTYTDTSNYDADIEEAMMAFESWDKELDALLNEGMTVSISKGQQGMPDSVSVSAQDAEADQLLGLIKQAGMGLFGGEDKPEGFMPDVTGMSATGEEEGRDSDDIGVVDDHEGMMALIKKVVGGEQQPEEVGAGSDEGHDYEGEDQPEGQEEEHHDHESHDEHEHDEHEETNEETCNECGMLESSCECDDQQVDEVESYDQEEYIVAEDNAPDSDEAETSADEEAEAEEDTALAKADELNEWANEAGKKGTDESFETDIAFITRAIAGGLNKEKATGQTTIPVIPGQNDRMGYSATNESILDWKKLAGLK